MQMFASKAGHNAVVCSVCAHQSIARPEVTGISVLLSETQHRGHSDIAKTLYKFQRHKTPTVVGAGFETMAGAQHSMMENASRIASRDQVSLDQVQQTAARGEAHVQGKLVCTHIHCMQQLLQFFDDGHKGTRLGNNAGH